MKHVLYIAHLVIIILMTGGLNAHAAHFYSDFYDEINWTNPNNPLDSGTKIKPSDPAYPELDFTLTLESPYTPGAELTSAQLVLYLADDSSYASSVEASLGISLPGGKNTFDTFIVEGACKEYTIDISEPAVLDELASGSLTFNLGVTTNGDEKYKPDYILYDAQMSAQAVPIAPAIVLLGSGLFGLAGITRRRSRK